MLYVFLVDTGTMLTFDITLTMDRVDNLQKAIVKMCKIPIDKQVLLISGGESLQPDSKVCTYGAGTDTNPIYLFSKNTIEDANPPIASINYGLGRDIKEKAESALSFPSSYDTIVTRAEIAMDFGEVAQEELKVCERLVHDQHLQHQGWAAVIANLEDITMAFSKRAHAFKEHFTQFDAKREEYKRTIDNFPNTLNLLRRIPLLACLEKVILSKNDDAVALQHQEHQKPMPQELNLSSHASSHVAANDSSLLDWILSKDKSSSLTYLRDTTQTAMEKFSGQNQSSILSDVEMTLSAANNQCMKEIRGLEDRLYGLEQLLHGARKVQQEQRDIAQGFVANQTRARNLKDASVLPDLCASHQGQLVVMINNHDGLRDIRRRCVAAKDELSFNLHQRLRWVMWLEKMMCDIDSRIVFQMDSLRQLQKRLEVLGQVSRAPIVYCLSVCEVVRRRHFSHRFHSWAEGLAEQRLRQHMRELDRRKRFHQVLSVHFLRSLFPGVDDAPPSFATELPAMFDTRLPEVKDDDVEQLRAVLPELRDNLTLVTESAEDDFQFADKPRKEVVGQCGAADKSVEKAMTMDINDSITGNMPFPCSHTPTVDYSNSGHSFFKNKEDDNKEVIEKEKSESDNESCLSFSSLPRSLPSISSPPCSSLPKALYSSINSPKSDDDFSSVQLNFETACAISPLTSPSDFSPGAAGFETADFYLDESLPLIPDTTLPGSSIPYATPLQKLTETQFAFEKTALVNKWKHEGEMFESKYKGDVECKRLYSGKLCSNPFSFEQNYEIVVKPIVAKLRNDIKTLRCEVRDQVASQQQQLTEAIKHLKLINDAYSEVETQNIELLHEKNERIDALKAELDLLKNELKVTQETLSNKVTMIDKLQSQQKQTIEEAAENIEVMTMQHEKILQEFRLKIDSDTEARQQLLTDIEKLNCRNDELENTLKLNADFYREDMESKLEGQSAKFNQEKLILLKQKEDEHVANLSAAIEQVILSYKNEKIEFNKKCELRIKMEVEKKVAEEKIRIETENAQCLSEDRDRLQKEMNRIVEQHERQHEKDVTRRKENYDRRAEDLLTKVEGVAKQCMQSMRDSMTSEQQISLQTALNDLRSQQDDNIASLPKKDIRVDKDIGRKIERATITADMDSESIDIDPSVVDLTATSLRETALMKESTDISIIFQQQQRQSLKRNVIKIKDEDADEREKTQKGKLSDRISMQRCSDSCDPGDVVLLCLDERHGQFVVFTINTATHFLHHECLRPLGLDIRNRTKTWVLAVITHKEYVLTKKQTNRFNVPSGSTFYRVKAVPWVPPPTTEPADTDVRSSPHPNLSPPTADHVGTSKAEKDSESKTETSSQ